ncbi:MAG: hypothetical protein QF412_11385 [Planctomycetota bacterium]|jgi:hypothetical protein|nr:hypothetical protein [Planctomycetota bacterium]
MFTTLGRIFAITALIAGSLATQENAPEPVPARHITFQNLAPFARREWVATIVPFKSGEVPAGELPDLHVSERATLWLPFGARWPDGSLRFARCLVRIEITKFGELRLPLLPGSGPALASELPGLPAKLPVVSVRQGAEVATATPKLVRLLEVSSVRAVGLFRCRIGQSGLVFEMILEAYAGQAHCPIDLAVFYSDPRKKALQCQIEELAVSTNGVALVLRHAGSLNMEHQIDKTGGRVVLLRKTVLGDGQGIRRSGVLVPRLAGDGGLNDESLMAAVTCPLLGAVRWGSSGAFGPFGHVPEPPPWLQGPALRGGLARRHSAFVRAGQTQLGKPGAGDPFKSFGLGLAKRAGQTGDQEDFGVVKLSCVPASGLPSMLHEAELSVLQEACRPVHFFEADGSRVVSSKHPQWVVWSGRTHWHCKQSKDRLGKPCPAPKFESHGWTGKDRQHWSSNYLASYHLLTGKHWALREIENEVELYLAGQTLGADKATSGPGAPRGAGRSIMAACWLYLCTGNQELLERMHARIDRIHYPSWAGRELGEDRMRTFQVQAPDARMLRGSTRYWTPWQDSLAVIGFAAFAKMTGNKHAREMADEIAMTIVRHGWKVTDSETIIATAIRWEDGGAPPSAEEFDDPEKVLWSYGTGFSQWGIGAVEIARQAALRRDDKDLQQRAETILNRVRAAQRRPNNGWYDRLTEWDAVPTGN